MLARPAPRSFEAQMLAAADRLFAEFEELPVLTVVRAVNGARTELRERGAAPSPPAIEAAARQRLLRARAAGDVAPPAPAGRCG